MPVNNGAETSLRTDNLQSISNSASTTNATTNKGGTASLAVSVPPYDREALRRSIVHIGVGGFHRAHLAAYVDELCRNGNTDWSIVGGGILASDERIRTALAEQDSLYTLVVRAPEKTTARVIGSIVDFIHGHPDPTELIERIASPETQIVSMTITEGGYPVHDETGEYEPDSPVAGKNSAFGIIAAALELRRTFGHGPLTIVSCDNIVSNGSFARRATIGEATKVSGELVEWINVNVGFPNSMVDRITPATTDADREWLAEQTGIIDRWPVMTEPFTQWVVEDTFAGERPPLEELDVILTDDVEPYERMKLQLLNAGHSCLAYLAALVGHELVHDAMLDPPLRQYFDAFLDQEAGPVLPTVEGIDLEAYKRSLVERFSNPAIADQIARLCLDGSAKFPKFLLPTVRAQLAADGPITLSALALAGWCRYLQGVADDGSPITPSPDPKLSEAVAYAKRAATDAGEFLKFADVFGNDLPADDRFVSAFASTLEELQSNGVTKTIYSALGQPHS